MTVITTSTACLHQLGAKIVEHAVQLLPTYMSVRSLFIQLHYYRKMASTSLLPFKSFIKCLPEASLAAEMVKNPPAMQESPVWFLSWEDLLEKGMATHSSVLAWRILGTVEPGGLPSMGSHRVGQDWSDLAAAAASLYKQFEWTMIKWLYFLDEKSKTDGFIINSKYL